MKVFKVVIFVVLFPSYTSAKSKAYENSTARGTENKILDEWKEMDKQMKNNMQSMVKAFLPTIMATAHKVNLTHECAKEILHIIKGLRNLDLWALKFLDSSSKIPDGVLSGAVSSFGVYEECVENIALDQKNKDKVLFRGQYCTLDIRPPLPPKSRIYRKNDLLDELKNFTGTEVMKFMSKKAHLFYFVPMKIGICVPSGCSAKDIEPIAKLMVRDYRLKIKVRRCDVKEDTHFDAIQIFTLTLSSFLTFLVILGTYLEWYSKKVKIEFKSTTSRILLCFSAISNFKKVVSTKAADGKFKCLHGIRFLSIMYVCLGHTYSYPAFFPNSLRTLFQVEQIFAESPALTITNSSEVVDTFLFIGGLLVSYFTVQALKMNKKNFSYLSYVVHRLFRIIPVYYFIVLMAFLTPLMGSGPIYHDVLDNYIYPCYNYWWTNIFFINNFFDFRKMCIFHSWYVACDLQMYLVAPLIILLLVRNEKIGLFVNFLIIGGSVVYTGIMTHVLGIGPGLHPNHIDMEDRVNGFIAIYANPFSRSGSYFIGVFTGYILISKPDLKIPKKYLWLGWSVATICSASAIYSVALWTPERWPERWEVELYGSLLKVLWSSGVAWMTFCCASGHGGIINDILSWKAWIPLGKLTFLIYMIQPIIQVLFISVTKHTNDYTHFYNIITSFGIFCMSSLLALLCNLLVESPFISIEKVALQRPKKGGDVVKEKSVENVTQISSVNTDTSIQMNAWEVHQENHANTNGWEVHQENHANTNGWEVHQDNHANTNAWEVHQDNHANTNADTRIEENGTRMHQDNHANTNADTRIEENGTRMHQETHAENNIPRESYS